jgi:NAD(P)-dependent dehydrogenase (short-subunit alcohol dehydrogenase family)
MNCLIVGGTSGLGLAMAEQLKAENTVYITGRHDPQAEGMTFHELQLGKLDGLLANIHTLVEALPKLDLVVYAPGFYQEGTITDLNEDQIQEMLSVGVTGAMYVAREVLNKQGELAEFVAITSTSQYTPRLLEPVYTVAKAGLGAFSNSLSLDPRVKKTLVAGPAGIKTKFHEGRDVDMSTYLTPEWTAEQVIEHLSGDYIYKYIRILREPAHVEVIETRV